MHEPLTSRPGPPPPAAGEKGIHYDAQRHRWVTQASVKGNTEKKAFKINDHGNEGAYELARQWRREAMSRLTAMAAATTDAGYSTYKTNLQMVGTTEQQQPAPQLSAELQEDTPVIQEKRQ